METTLNVHHGLQVFSSRNADYHRTRPVSKKQSNPSLLDACPIVVDSLSLGASICRLLQSIFSHPLHHPPGFPSSASSASSLSCILIQPPIHRASRQFKRPASLHLARPFNNASNLKVGTDQKNSITYIHISSSTLPPSFDIYSSSIYPVVIFLQLAQASLSG